MSKTVSSIERASEAERLVGYVRKFARRRIVVLGDLVADEFLYGDITRVSREAPVLILDHRRTVAVPGGGANTVANLRVLGAHPLPVGVIGKDESGRRLIDAFKRIRVATGGLVAVEGYSTPSKCRILAGGTHTRRQQIVRVDRGSHRGEFSRPIRAALRRHLRGALRKAAGLLIADYGYGSASPALLEGILGKLVERGVPVTVDSRSRIVEFRGVSACTPNQEELEQALGLESIPDEEIAQAGRLLLRRSANRAVLVTRGAKGMVLFQRRRPPLLIPAYGTDEVADVTGAGDTVIAAFTLALIAGADHADAARLANYAAGIVVTKAGTATMTRDELVRAIRKDLE